MVNQHPFFSQTSVTLPFTATFSTFLISFLSFLPNFSTEIALDSTEEATTDP
ncbi:hypothetical protein D3C78_1823680 [compost metagenome]